MWLLTFWVLTVPSPSLVSDTALHTLQSQKVSFTLYIVSKFAALRALWRWLLAQLALVAWAHATLVARHEREHTEAHISLLDTVRMVERCRAKHRLRGYKIMSKFKDGGRD